MKLVRLAVVKLLVVLIFFIAGCSESVVIERSSRQKCMSMEEKRELASFIIKCSEAANPKSDEEGEDLVIQCERTGINTLCQTVDVCRTTIERSFPRHSSPGDWGPCK